MGLGLALLAPTADWAPVEAGQPGIERQSGPWFGLRGLPWRQRASKLLDLSGLVWIGGDRFLTVHDAKNPDELKRTRVTLLELPQSLAGILMRPLRPRFPGGASSDLESAAGVPGHDVVLLAESGDDAGPFRRIFKAKLGHARLKILDVVEWDSFTDVFNVEATAVADTDSGLIFLWAERSSGAQSTDINWADLSLSPFVIGGNSGSVQFTLPVDFVNENGNPLYSRPIVGMDLDSDGNVYIVTAFDPEDSVPDPDNGPFRSAVLKIGQVIDGAVVLDATPTTLAVVDGFKIESVAVRETDGQLELFVGTDDENYGGTLRILPPLDLP